jgi:hypothetical protein
MGMVGVPHDTAPGGVDRTPRRTGRSRVAPPWGIIEHAPDSTGDGAKGIVVKSRVWSKGTRRQRRQGRSIRVAPLVLVAFVAGALPLPRESMADPPTIETPTTAGPAAAPTEAKSIEFHSAGTQSDPGVDVEQWVRTREAAAAQAPGAPDHAAATDDAAARGDDPPPTDDEDTAAAEPVAVAPAPPAEPAAAEPVAVAPAVQTESTVAEPVAEPAAPVAQPPTGGANVEAWIQRGDDLLSTGDIASARLFYRLAAEAGSAVAAGRAGMTHDPLYFREIGVVGISPDPGTALQWYTLGQSRGDSASSERLESLVRSLQAAAEAGDENAQRVLAAAGL